MKVITFFLTLTLLLTHYQIWIHDGGLHKQHEEMSEKVEALQQKNATLEIKNAILKAEVEDLQHGYETLSELARNNMGYIRQGEVFYEIEQ